jgi:hypothetical protein
MPASSSISSGHHPHAGKRSQPEAAPSVGFKAQPAPLSRANAGRSSVPNSVRKVLITICGMLVTT